MAAQQPSPAEFNQQIIEEFRANGGRVGGMFEGAPLVLLTTTGARSGQRRTNPAVYLRDGARILVFASNAGAPRHPAWFHNLLAHPRVTVEIGTDDGNGVQRYPADAVPLEGEERDRLYAQQAALDPAFADYERRTSRVIPVVGLHYAIFADPERSRAAGEQVLKAHHELRAELAAVRRGGPAVSGEALTRHCLTFCSALEEHHGSEDGAFGAMEREFPRLAPTLRRLREEHREVARALARLRALLESGAGAGERLGPELAALTAELEEHFAYEERELLPALGVR